MPGILGHSYVWRSAGTAVICTASTPTAAREALRLRQGRGAEIDAAAAPAKTLSTLPAAVRNTGADSQGVPASGRDLQVAPGSSTGTAPYCASGRNGCMPLTSLFAGSAALKTDAHQAMDLGRHLPPRYA